MLNTKMPGSGKYTLVADSSQISTFLECPQKWINQYVKHLEPSFFEPDENMSKGTYGHRLLEIYYKLRCGGASVNDAVEAYNKYNPDTDVCECGCSKDYHCAVPLFEMEECRRCRRCTKFRPRPFFLSSMDRGAVRKRMIEYIHKYQNGDIQPLSENHIEVGFSENIYEDSENLYILEGRIDLIGKIDGLDVFMDHKTQNFAHRIYPDSVQFKNYALVTKITTGIINYIRLTQKMQPDTLVRVNVMTNSVKIAAWHKRLIQIFHRMRKTKQALEHSMPDGIDRNWSACSGKQLTFEKDKDKPKWCWYRDLCEQIDPRVIQNTENSLFKINENPWRPW